jgi:hypothetical protein
VRHVLCEFLLAAADRLPINILRVKAYTNTLKLYRAITGYTREEDVRRLGAFVGSMLGEDRDALDALYRLIGRRTR